MQTSVSVSMVEGTLIVVCEAVQIMLYSMHVLEDIGLCVRKPMILWVDCKGVLDLTYGWNVSGLTKHVSVRACFLCELKEANLVLCAWLPMDANMVDLTKHVSVRACSLHELIERANLVLYVWLPKDANVVDMYTQNVSPHLHDHH